MKKLLLLLASSFILVSSVSAANPDLIIETTKDSSFGIGGLIGIFTPIFIYCFYAYCQYSLMKKLNVEGAGLSWIPLFNLIPLLRSASMSGWWILGMFVPLLNIYVMIKMLHNGVSLRTGHDAGWTVGLIFLGAIMFPITALTYNVPTQPTPAPQSV